MLSGNIKNWGFDVSDKFVGLMPRVMNVLGDQFCTGISGNEPVLSIFDYMAMGNDQMKVINMNRKGELFKTNIKVNGSKEPDMIARDVTEFTITTMPNVKTRPYKIFVNDELFIKTTGIYNGIYECGKNETVNKKYFTVTCRDENVTITQDCVPFEANLLVNGSTTPDEIGSAVTSFTITTAPVSTEVSYDIFVNDNLFVTTRGNYSGVYECGENTTEEKREFTVTCSEESVTILQSEYKPKVTGHLEFKITSDGIIKWSGTSAKVIEYSKDSGETWTSITASTATTIPVVAGDAVLFKGNNNTYSGSTFSGTTCQFELEGNIMSLIYGDDFSGQTVLVSGYTFIDLFNGCTGLTSAENLKLPATTLTDSCYRQMFYGCTSLVETPVLPATKINNSAYYSMFQGCTSLTTAPELPATEVYSNGYTAMFKECTSLVEAPELPATTINHSAYHSMFQGCTSLVTAPELPATEIDSNGYTAMFKGCSSLVNISKLPATTIGNSCYREMFQDCTSLQVVPSDLLPSKSLIYHCYRNMFAGCTSLQTSPELPAITLMDGCYQEMFSGCSSLNYITCLAQNISASQCTYNWVRGVASTGTFVKSTSMTSWTRGGSGIPEGWVVENNEDYFRFKVTGNGNITWAVKEYSTPKTISYSKNFGETWTEITSDIGSSAPTIAVNSGDVVFFKSENIGLSGSTFSGTTCQFELEGNIMSLLYGDDFKDKTVLVSGYTFIDLFNGCTGLTSAGSLKLPATIATDSCYRQMFYGCSSLVETPVLPATKVNNSAYYSMFERCTLLTTAPELPATEVYSNGYSSMFKGCSSLVNISKLTATTIGNSCYSSMFQDCTSLQTIPSDLLPSKNLMTSCYNDMFKGCSSLQTIPDNLLPANALTSNCYRGMFQDCTSLQVVPNDLLPSKSLSTYCYRDMFAGCSSLLTAPELPASILQENCYYGMFSGCSSLNYITCLAQNITAFNCTYNWVRGVDTTGTFVKSLLMTNWTTGYNGIPEGWEVENVNP